MSIALFISRCCVLWRLLRVAVIVTCVLAWESRRKQDTAAYSHDHSEHLVIDNALMPAFARMQEDGTSSPHLFKRMHTPRAQSPESSHTEPKGTLPSAEPPATGVSVDHLPPELFDEYRQLSPRVKQRLEQHLGRQILREKAREHPAVQHVLDRGVPAYLRPGLEHATGRLELENRADTADKLARLHKSVIKQYALRHLYGEAAAHHPHLALAPGQAPRRERLPPRAQALLATVKRDIDVRSPRALVEAAGRYTVTEDGGPPLPPAVRLRLAATLAAHAPEALAAGDRARLDGLLRDGHQSEADDPMPVLGMPIESFARDGLRALAGPPDAAWSRWLRDNWGRLRPEVRARIAEEARAAKAAGRPVSFYGPPPGVPQWGRHERTERALQRAGLRSHESSGALHESTSTGEPQGGRGADAVGTSGSVGAEESGRSSPHHGNK